MIRQKTIRFLRDPLLHFLILGAVLFLAYSLVNGSGEASPKRVVIDAPEIKRLAGQFERTWMRQPTRAELMGLVEEYTKEEVLYREARALGLDEDDLVIRRRLRQKMEFLNADLVELQPPTDAQLQAYFDANQERFKRPDLFSFQQVYLNPDKLEGDAGQAAVELLARLNTGPAPVVDPGAFGHTTLLPYQLVGVTKREILNTFGPTFANQIVNAPVGRWSGPHESSYGLHLVRVSGRDLGGLPPLTEIRPILERGWYAERRIEADDRFYRAIRARYDIKIRLPADLAGKTLAVR